MSSNKIVNSQGIFQSCSSHLFSFFLLFPWESRGIYLACILYHEDKILVTNEDCLPVIEIDETYPSSLHTDYHWLMKVCRPFLLLLLSLFVIDSVHAWHKFAVRTNVGCVYLGRCEVAATRHGEECHVGRSFSHQTFDRRLSDAVGAVHSRSGPIVS